MKKRLLIGITVLVILAVVLYIRNQSFKEPEFIGLRDLQLNQMNGFKASLSGTAVFMNPNRSEAELLNTELKIRSNGVHVAGISQNGLVRIAKESEFSVPFKAEADLLKLGLSQSVSGILDKALSKDRSIPLEFEGYCRVRIGREIVRIPVHYSETIQIR